MYERERESFTYSDSLWSLSGFSTMRSRFWIAIDSHRCLRSLRVYAHIKEYPFPIRNNAWVLSEEEKTKEREKEKERKRWRKRKRETECERSARIAEFNRVILGPIVLRERIRVICCSSMRWCCVCYIFPRMWMSVAVGCFIKVNILMAQVI